MIYENRNYYDGHFPFACAVMDGSQPFMSHCHKEMEIILVRRGRLFVSYEGESCSLSEGELWFVPPFCSHSIDGGDDESLRLAVLLDLDLMGWVKQEEEEPQMTALLEQTHMYSGHWPEPARQKLSALVEGMYEEYVEQSAGWELAIKTKLNAFMLTVLRELPRCERRLPSRQVAKVRAVLEYAALNYCGDISLRACADKVGFNPTYLSRYFHEHMGMTFQEYIKKLRIDRACWLLGNRRMPVTEVAYASGFKDIKTFNKLFKKECGVSPSQFRKGSAGKA